MKPIHESGLTSPLFDTLAAGRAGLREILDERPEDQYEEPPAGRHDCDDYVVELAPRTSLSPAEYGCAICEAL